MSWFRLDDKAAFHAKIVKAGNEAAGAVWRAGAWCSEHDRSGFVPEGVAHLIAPPKVWAKAIAAGMAHAVDDGYRIHDFNDYNPSDSDVDAMREAKRAAGRAGGFSSGRSRRSKTEAGASLLGSRTEAGASPEGAEQTKQTRSHAHTHAHDLQIPPKPPEGVAGEPMIDSPPVQATRDGAFGMTAGAWAEGVRAKTGGAVTRLDLRQTRALLALCDAHAGGRTGQALLEWVTATASEFASTVDASYGGYTPVRCANWLDAGKPRERAKGPAKREIQNSPVQSFETSDASDVHEAIQRGQGIGGAR